ncbi:hypothetical protein BGX28_004322 [Mortierella sp. GBA30]|nr:hypothetical protein BGX28_004322 [Mortierella sp. GBA30]
MVVPTSSPSSSSPSSISTIPVLIAGGGPVGLFQAYLLTKLGIQVRIIERENAISPYSKAFGMHARTLEIFQFVGIIDEFMKRGLPMTDFKMYFGNQHVSSIPVTLGTDSHYCFGLFLEQAKTSEILVNELDKMGVKVEFGWELLDTKVMREEGKDSYVETAIRRSLSGDNTSPEEKMVLARVDLLEEQEGKEYEVQTVRSQYLVAADGGRSTVRHKLNIGFNGRTLSEKSLMWDGTYESDCDLSGITFISGVNHRPMLVFPLTNGEVRVAVGCPDEETNEDITTTIKNLTVEKFEQLASECIAPSTFKIKTTSWLTCFKVNERRADNFIYKNRIFLAGDAAHVHSPAGGQGLNTGLQDAHNLAWKLALVLNKVAPESILTSYEEREAMADRAIALSSKMQRNRTVGNVSSFANRVYLTLAPYIMTVMRVLGIQPQTSMLDVHYQQNALNKAHDAQQLTRSDYQVGVRAKDGPLCRLGFTLNDKTPAQLRLHDLLLGIGRFHILVFTSDMLATTAGGPPIQGISTTNAKQLADNIDRFLTQWRSRMIYAADLNDGYKDKDLFKVHIVASSFTPNGLGALIKKELGEGKTFLDHTKKVHEKYGFAKSRGYGGIVVVRPDSYIGYRVNGAADQAWEDVNQYFSSILSI